MVSSIHENSDDGEGYQAKVNLTGENLKSLKWMCTSEQILEKKSLCFDQSNLKKTPKKLSIASEQITYKVSEKKSKKKRKSKSVKKKLEEISEDDSKEENKNEKIRKTRP